MKLVNQISVNDDTFSIIEMDLIDRDIITGRVGPLNGQWICYSGLMTITSDSFRHQRGRIQFWAEVTPEMTFVTQREAELYAQMRIYQKAYDKMAYYASLVRFSGSLMQDTVSKIQDAKLKNHFNHKEEK